MPAGGPKLNRNKASQDVKKQDYLDTFLKQLESGLETNIKGELGELKVEIAQTIMEKLGLPAGSEMDVTKEYADAFTQVMKSLTESGEKVGMDQVEGVTIIHVDETTDIEVLEMKVEPLLSYYQMTIEDGMMQFTNQAGELSIVIALDKHNRGTESNSEHNGIKMPEKGKFDDLKNSFLTILHSFPDEINAILQYGTFGHIKKVIDLIPAKLQHLCLISNHITSVDTETEGGVGIKLIEEMMKDSFGDIISSMESINYANQWYFIGKLITQLPTEISLKNIVPNNLETLALKQLSNMESYLGSITYLSSMSKTFLSDELDFISQEFAKTGVESNAYKEKANTIIASMEKFDTLDLNSLSMETQNLVKEFPVLLHYSHIIPDFSNLKIEQIINPNEGTNGLIIAIENKTKVIKIPRDITGQGGFHPAKRVNTLYSEILQHNLVLQQNVESNILIPDQDVSSINNFAPAVVMDFIPGYTVDVRFRSILGPTLQSIDVQNITLSQSQAKQLVDSSLQDEDVTFFTNLVEEYHYEFEQELDKQGLSEFKVNIDSQDRCSIFQFYVLTKFDTPQSLQRGKKYLELIKILKDFKNKGIILGDRNSGNTMIDPLIGNVTILDFGLIEASNE